MRNGWIGSIRGTGVSPVDSCTHESWRSQFSGSAFPRERGKGKNHGRAARATAILALLLAFGCAANPQTRKQLDTGESALKALNYDQAVKSADEVIATRDASIAAEAYYLRGRAVEDRPKHDSRAAASDLNEARTDYSAALTQNPSQPLEARLHAQLGNVAYFQDDYAAAAREWTLAYDQLDKPQWKQWVLYRIGLCQQRLGRFSEADRTFALVQQEYPNSEPAQRAKSHQGIHGFFVQVGAFASEADIDKAAAAIVAAGSVPMKTLDKGLTVMRTAVVPSYRQALTLKTNLSARYPGAVVLP